MTVKAFHSVIADHFQFIKFMATSKKNLLRLTLTEHLLEMRKRMLLVLLVFLTTFCLGYFLSAEIYKFLLKPLANYYAKEGEQGRVIYTGLTEAFFSYLKLASYFAIFCTLPFCAIQIYLFIAPALGGNAKAFLMPCLFITPLLFISGALVAYYWIFPNAWQFFLGFETGGQSSNLPIKLEARVSEYLALSIEIMIGFGIAFQLPLFLVTLTKLNLISIGSLKKKRRLAVVIIFIIAAIITPPDILSQFILAGIMIVLYELSILSCTFLQSKNRRPYA